MVAEPVIYLVVWSTIADQSGGDGRRAHRGRVRRVLHRLDARSEHEHRLHAVRLGVSGSARASSRASSCAPCIRSTTTSRGSPAGRFPGFSSTCRSRRSLTLVFNPTLRRPAARDRRLRGRHLGRVPHPDVLPVGARDDHLLDDARRCALPALHHARAACSPDGSCPLTLMPDWVQTAAWFLPFQWTFYFPIQTLVGEFSNERARSAASGCRLFWTLVGIGSSRWSGATPIRRYTAVGN